MAVDLINHPGKNPDYDRLMSARRGIMAENKAWASMGIPRLPVPPPPAKQIHPPHRSKAERKEMSTGSFLWAGRGMLAVAVIGVAIGSTNLAVSTAFLVGAIFYATAGIIEAIESHHSKAKGEGDE